MNVYVLLQSARDLPVCCLTVCSVRGVLTLTLIFHDLASLASPISQA